ncbi:MAG: CoA pyrophosphatase [Bifidobacteriales bacterium]|nr:CoA pyrophosphatase [Bifidobacteriales bacterium]
MAESIAIQIADIVKKFNEPEVLSPAPEALNGDQNLNRPFSNSLILRQKSDRPSWQRSAVLIGIIEKSNAPHLVLTRRTSKLHNHAGQIAFPGGKREDQDKSDEMTALREAREEIGLQPDYFTKLGELCFHYTSTGFEIRPVVGLIGQGAQFVKNDNEVDEIFTVQLSFVLDLKNYVIVSKTAGAEMRSFYALSCENHYIWGATAAMIRSLAERLSR